MGVMLQAAIVVAIIYFTVSQIFIPAWRGTRPFPMFGKRRRFEEELERLRTEAEAERVREMAVREAKQLEELRARINNRRKEQEDGDRIRNENDGE